LLKKKGISINCSFGAKTQEEASGPFLKTIWNKMPFIPVIPPSKTSEWGNSRSITNKADGCTSTETRIEDQPPFPRYKFKGGTAPPKYPILCELLIPLVFKFG